MYRTISYGQHKQRQCRSYQQTSHDSCRHSAEHSVEQQRQHTQNRSSRSHRHRYDTAGSSTHYRIQRCLSGSSFHINLVYQYNGILDIHTNQSQQTEDGEEVERLAEHQQPQHNTDEDKRQHQQDDNWLTVCAEQEQQCDEHQEKRQRQVGSQCRVAFRLAFLLSEVLHGVSFRHLNLLLHLFPHPVEGSDGIHSTAWVGLCHHHHLSVIIFHVRELILEIEFTDHLFQRSGLLGGAEYRKRAQVVDAERVYRVVL